MYPCVLKFEGLTVCFHLRRFWFGNRRWIGRKYPPLSTAFFFVITYTNGIICGGAASVFAHSFQKNTLFFSRDNASPCCTERELTTSVNHHQITGNVDKAINLQEDGFGIDEMVLPTWKVTFCRRTLRVWNSTHLGEASLSSRSIGELSSFGEAHFEMCGAICCCHQD